MFAEVKLRKGLTMGYPREAVGYAKQNKLRKTALSYLSFHNIADADIRFDVVEIICAEDTVVEHIENAF